jgi:cystathionine beta-synthase
MRPILQSIRDAVGGTPLVHAARYAAGWGHELLLKCELMNPGGSVKDRIAFAMIEEAERRGRIKPGDTLVEATASNTGFGLGMVAALRGYKLVTVLTTKASAEKVALMRAIGAEVVIVPKEAGPDDPNNFFNRARQIAEERPNAWWVDQFANPDNIAVHYEQTAAEIWEQTSGRVDAFVAGIGTGGSITGIGRYLKERKPGVRIVLADPIGSVLADLVEGNPPPEPAAYIVEGIGQSKAPGNADLPLIDRAIRVTDADSIRAARRLFETEGIFAGSSTGCILSAAQRFCEQSERKNLCVVALAPDGGRSYLSTIHNDEWRRANGFE